MNSCAFSHSGKMTGRRYEMLSSQSAILKQKKMDCVCRSVRSKFPCKCGIGTYVCKTCLECLFCKPCVDCNGICSGRRAYICDDCNARSCGVFFKAPVECILDECSCDGYLYRCRDCYVRMWTSRRVNRKGG